ncbi:PREDICTED: UDP-glycosyltransferase 87A1-like [Tarenaya hassleriana]|uniref:UDP-glycosyltransferase 87A1-like n=1 Tax=Tarenaya hassleriana TaxID=28532 RepID=UPI00053C1579|nr:PREDICTED: UDP-glycosyltransferase 87A1-like [Tarenaya hassleriana]
MEAPLEKLLDGTEEPPCLLVADTFLLEAAVRVAGRRNIPVAAFWPTSVAMFTLYQHLHLLEQNGHYNLQLSEANDVRVDYVPGLSPTSLHEILGVFNGLHDFILPKFREAFSLVPKTQCVMISSIYELEPQALDRLRAILKTPLLTVAPPTSNVAHGPSHHVDQDYIKWLDGRPEDSVLYIAFGSHVPVSPQQMDEVMAGLRETGVNFLLVARSNTDGLKELRGDKGFVVPWCDQVRVLSHRSVGGFWSHCGWNSTKEGVMAGVTFLTFPFYGDQILISKLIVEDWRIGLKVKERHDEALVPREKIVEVVKKIMDPNHNESKEMRKRAKEMKERVLENGSLGENIDSFVKVIRSVSKNQ